MISLMNVSRFYGSPKEPTIVLYDVSLRVNPLDRVGILAASGSGKSTLARIISGQERPDMGQVTRSSRVSWPIGFSSVFHPQLSSADNIDIIARLWNHDPHELTAKVCDFSELGASFYKPFGDLAPGKRVQMGQSLSMCTDFDFYLADDIIASSNPAFRDKCEAALQDKLKSSGLIMLSRHARMLTTFATRFFVLFNAALIECGTAQEAQDVLDILTNEDADPYATV